MVEQEVFRRRKDTGEALERISPVGSEQSHRAWQIDRLLYDSSLARESKLPDSEVQLLSPAPFARVR